MALFPDESLHTPFSPWPEPCKCVYALKEKVQKRFSRKLKKAQRRDYVVLKTGHFPNIECDKYTLMNLIVTFSVYCTINNLRTYYVLPQPTQKPLFLLYKLKSFSAIARAMNCHDVYFRNNLYKQTLSWIDTILCNKCYPYIYEPSNFTSKKTFYFSLYRYAFYLQS